ncbi:MAG: hypothetical protein ABIJ45_15345 [Candidatus Zixiibacteriota bacterium]
MKLLKKSPDKTISLHSYVRWKTDISHKLAEDPETYIYDLYLKFGGLPKNSQILLGRQFVYSGVGSALIDGLMVQYDYSRKFKIKIFGGSDVSASNPEMINSFSDNALYGGQLSYRLSSLYYFGLNWMMKYDWGEIAYNRIGLEFKYRPDKLNINTKAAYNLANQRLGILMIRSSYILPKYYFSAEFNYREPYVSSNSLFSLIDFEYYKQIRFEGHRLLGNKMRFVARANINLYSDDNSIVYGAGFNGVFWSLLYQHQSGKSGNNNGVTGFVNVRITSTWSAYARAGINRYKIQDMQDDLSDSYNTILGLEKRIGKDFIFRSEGQYLRNAIENSDTRFYLKLSKGFSIK